MNPKTSFPLATSVRSWLASALIVTAATFLVIHPVAAQTEVTGTNTGVAGASGPGLPPDGDGESDGYAGGSGYDAYGSISPSFTVHDANLTGGRGGDVTGAGTVREYKAGPGGNGLNSGSNAMVTVDSGTFIGGIGGNTDGAGGTQQSQGGNGGNGAGAGGGATVTFNGGTFQGGIGGTSSATSTAGAYDSGGGGGAGLFAQDATVYINGGAFLGSESGQLAGEPTNTSTGNHGGGINANNGSVITIKGGTFQGGNDVPVANGGESNGADGLTGLGGTVDVYGGTFIAGNDGNGNDEGFGIDAVFGSITVHGQFTLTTGGNTYSGYTGAIPVGNGTLTGYFDGSTTQQSFTYEVESGTGATLNVVPSSSSTPTPTPGPTPTPNPSATPTPTPNPSRTPTPTPNPSATPTPTPNPSRTPTPTPNPSATPTPTPRSSATPTPALGNLACAIISPPAGAPIAAGSSLPFAVAVRDSANFTVVSVSYYLDGRQVGTTGATGPFYVTVTAPSAGTHQLMAIARDNDGQTASGSEQFTTHNANNPPPTITSIDGLDDHNVVDGEMVVDTVETKSNGNTEGGGGNDDPVEETTYYWDGDSAEDDMPTPVEPEPDAWRGHGLVRLDASAVTPLAAGGSIYRLAITIGSGFIGNDIHIFAVARDKNGEQQISAVSTLHVKDAAVATPPVVTLGVPEGMRLPVGEATAVPVTITGANGGALSNPVALTQYLVNGKVVTDSSASPNGFSFTPPEAGQYLLNAAATDSLGLSGFGAPILVTAFDVPVVSLKVKGDGTAVAGGVPAKVLVNRTGDRSAALTVSYKATSADAVSGVDYRALTGKLVIPAGESSAKIKLTAIADSKSDGAAKVKIKLKPSADGSYTLGSTSKVQLKVLDND